MTTLTEQSLLLFLFQCFLATFVLLVETRDACACTRGFNASRLCRGRTQQQREGEVQYEACSLDAERMPRTSMSGGSRDKSLLVMAEDKPTRFTAKISGSRSVAEWVPESLQLICAGPAGRRHVT